MDLVLRAEVEDVLEEVIVEEIQDNHVFVTGSLVQVRERILCISLCMRSGIILFSFCSVSVTSVVWSSWQPWSCSVTCGQGIESLTRGCISGNTCRGSS